MRRIKITEENFHNIVKAITVAGSATFLIIKVIKDLKKN